MTYFIESDKHWRISKSGYSIKVGFMDEVRIVCEYPFARAPGPLDGKKFSLWLEDAEHICELHNASLGSESTISELRDRVAALEAEKAARDWQPIDGTDELETLRGKSSTGN